MLLFTVPLKMIVTNNNSVYDTNYTIRVADYLHFHVRERDLIIDNLIILFTECKVTLHNYLFYSLFIKC